MLRKFGLAGIGFDLVWFALDKLLKVTNMPDLFFVVIGIIGISLIVFELLPLMPKKLQMEARITNLQTISATDQMFVDGGEQGGADVWLQLNGKSRERMQVLRSWLQIGKYTIDAVSVLPKEIPKGDISIAVNFKIPKRLAIGSQRVKVVLKADNHAFTSRALKLPFPLEPHVREVF